MVEIALVLIGAAGSAAIILIWYYTSLGHLASERRVLRNWRDQLRADADRLNQQSQELAAVKTYKVKYDELTRENDSIKQDLFNYSVQLKKTERDHAAMMARQEELDTKANELARLYLKENIAWIGAKLTPNNFAACRKQLENAVKRCRNVAFTISEAEEEAFVADLRKNFEEAVRAQFAREEQARIKAQIREEERLAREIEKHIQEAQREQAAVEAALEIALKQADDQHSAEIETLRAKLKAAQEKAERAKSRAQMTRSGHVYVLSNIGSFGNDVFKVGMSRRLQPMERVSELSSASVPFPFDVHMMISCDDAPTLENALHRELRQHRVNKVNLRKEFFRVDLATIRTAVTKHHGEIDYTAEASAIQYHDTLEMTEEDYEYIEKTVESYLDDEDG